MGGGGFHQYFHLLDRSKSSLRGAEVMAAPDAYSSNAQATETALCRSDRLCATLDGFSNQKMIVSFHFKIIFLFH